MCREVFIRKQLGFIFDNDAALMMPRVWGNSGECNSEKRRVHCDQDGRVGDLQTPLCACACEAGNVISQGSKRALCRVRKLATGSLRRAYRFCLRTAVSRLRCNWRSTLQSLIGFAAL
jgi:hypothetical protein